MKLCLDIGATYTRIAVVEKTKIKNYKKLPTPKKQKDILKTLCQLISSYPKPKKICVSVAGFERNSKIQNALNLSLKNFPLSKYLKQKFHIPVFIENDANCAGLAELHYGAGKSLNNFILLTLGTGIGGAIVINKKLYRGNGGAGEIGSIYLNEKIFEHLASGGASVAIAKKFGLNVPSAYTLNEMANKKDKKALAVYKTLGHYLGVGLANLAYIFDPDAFIIGGGFSKVKHFYPSAKKSLNKFYHLTPKPKIIKAKFSADAELIGAGLIK